MAVDAKSLQESHTLALLETEEISCAAAATTTTVQPELDLPIMIIGHRGDAKPPPSPPVNSERCQRHPPRKGANLASLRAVSERRSVAVCKSLKWLLISQLAGLEAAAARLGLLLTSHISSQRDLDVRLSDCLNVESH